MGFYEEFGRTERYVQSNLEYLLLDIRELLTAQSDTMAEIRDLFAGIQTAQVEQTMPEHQHLERRDGKAYIVANGPCGGVGCDDCGCS